MPTDSETLSETTADNATALATLQPNIELTEAEKAKTYRDILHSHETGAHAKTNEASNWYDPEYGVKRIRRGSEYARQSFAFNWWLTLLYWALFTIQSLEFSAIKYA